MTYLLCLFLCLSSESFELADGSPEVESWKHFLTHERASQTKRALISARKYVPTLKKIFTEEGVPEDLVWLALIESSFRPDAVSPTNARGMFQFKKATARAFGLKVSGKVDERMNPQLAARASARYLLYLRAKFETWELVLAAYNLGEGDLRRAMAKHKKKTWEEIRPLLRVETQEYVAKIKAAAIIGNLEMAGKGNWETDVSTHLVHKGETLYSIAKKYQLDVDKLRSLNNLSGNHIEIGQILLLPDVP